MSDAKHRKTFRELVASLRERAAERLFVKARQANLVAKAIDGRHRDRAYRLKQGFLDRALQVFPGGFICVDDPAVGRIFVACRLATQRSGMHGSLMA